MTVKEIPVNIRCLEYRQDREDIDYVEKGTAPQVLTECNDEDAEIYSDVFEIDADYVWHEVTEGSGEKWQQ